MSKSSVVLEKDMLYQRYITENMKISEIATLYGVSVGTVHKYLRKYDIPKKTRHDYKAVARSSAIPDLVTPDNLYSVSQIVREVLKQSERASNDDNFLYFRVIGIVGDIKGVDVYHMPVAQFLLNIKEIGIPPFESVRRTRQKLQHDIPELAACKTVGEHQQAKEREFREYARG